jgi:glutathione S-transferase
LTSVQALGQAPIVELAKRQQEASVIELYHNDMSVCAQKVRLTLAEKGLSWTGHHLNLRAGNQHSPEYLKLNPNGVVPTLIDDGRVMIESTMICEYLDDAYPSPPLRPNDPYARGLMRLWTKKLDDWVHADTGTLSSCIAFRHQYLARLDTAEKLEAHLANMPSADKRTRQRANITQGIKSPYFAEALTRFATLFQQIETQLGQTRWLAGDIYSLADIGYTPYFLRMEQLGLGPAFYGPRVTDWGARLIERPSFATSIKGLLNPDYLTLFARERETAASAAQSILAA